jgi:ATP-dependent Clp protease adaptor protein ClpS
MALPDVAESERVDEELDVDPARQWTTVVWNDPVNLMSYVTWVFQKLFGYEKAEAQRLMLQVHNEGRSAVTTGNRERMELDVSRLHAYGLWATVEQA